MDEKHVARHARKRSEIDGESARVKFAPEVLRSFAGLEAAVRDSRHFDKDLLVNLQELASGKNYTVRAALWNISVLGRETLRYERATGDKRAGAAWDDLSEKLGFDERYTPLSVIVTKEKAR